MVLPQVGSLSPVPLNQGRDKLWASRPAQCRGQLAGLEKASWLQRLSGAAGRGCVHGEVDAGEEGREMRSPECAHGLPGSQEEQTGC